MAEDPAPAGSGELKVIGALVTAVVAQGRGGVLVAGGPTGIGKSRMLTEVMALAKKARCAPCSARHSRAFPRSHLRRHLW
jgi:Mg-chelatase subunit ChlI